MPFKRLHTIPTLLPIPQLNCHVITGGQNKRLGRVNDNSTDVVWVCLECRDLLGGVVVEYPQVEVVRSNDEPVPSGYETPGAYGHIRHFESLDDRLGFIGPDVGITCGEWPSAEALFRQAANTERDQFAYRYTRL